MSSWAIFISSSFPIKIAWLHLKSYFTCEYQWYRWDQRYRQMCCSSKTKPTDIYLHILPRSLSISIFSNTHTHFLTWYLSGAIQLISIVVTINRTEKGHIYDGAFVKSFGMISVLSITERNSWFSFEVN